MENKHVKFLISTMNSSQSISVYSNYGNMTETTQGP